MKATDLPLIFLHPAPEQHHSANQRPCPGRAPRLASLDDQLAQLGAAREKLAKELAAEEAPVEDFTGKVEKLKAQFNPANMEIIIHKPIYLARNNAD